MGQPIDPGVPFCFPVQLSGAGEAPGASGNASTGATGAEGAEGAAAENAAGEAGIAEGTSPSPLVVLKSGNFGAEDLYIRTARLGLDP